jgi:hypothetical protein
LEHCIHFFFFGRTKVAQIANLDPNWALQGNGLHHQQPGWLRLYIAACKLLDLALVLPADMLPQFQLYVPPQALSVPSHLPPLSPDIDGLSSAIATNPMSLAAGSKTKFRSSLPTLPGLLNC